MPASLGQRCLVELAGPREGQLASEPQAESNSLDARAALEQLRQHVSTQAVGAFSDLFGLLQRLPDADLAEQFKRKENCSIKKSLS